MAKNRSGKPVTVYDSHVNYVCVNKLEPYRLFLPYLVRVLVNPFTSPALFRVDRPGNLRVPYREMGARCSRGKSPRNWWNSIYGLQNQTVCEIASFDRGCAELKETDGSARPRKVFELRGNGQTSGKELAKSFCAGRPVKGIQITLILMHCWPSKLTETRWLLLFVSLLPIRSHFLRIFHFLGWGQSYWLDSFHPRWPFNLSP